MFDQSPFGPIGPPEQLVLSEIDADGGVLYGAQRSTRHAQRRLRRNRHRIRLATRIMTTGADLSPADAVAIAADVVVTSHGLADSSLTKLRSTWTHWVRHLDAAGIELLAEVTTPINEAFFWATHARSRTGSATTAANRRWAIDTLFTILRDEGLVEGDPPIGDPIDRSGSVVSSRPLTATEINTLKGYAAGLLATGDDLLVALSLAGGSAVEIARICHGDINLTDHTVTFSAPHDRHGPLDTWSHQRLIRAVDVTRPNELLVTGRRDASQSVTTRLTNLLRQAGFAGHTTVTARSIRLGAARQILDIDGLEAAARFLGANSLDQTARHLHYDWTQR